MARPRAQVAIPDRTGDELAVTAAATAITMEGTSWKTYRLGDQRWQEEAWRHYDICGELRYGANWISNAVSRCRLYVAEVDDKGKPGEETKDKDVQLLGETMFGDPAKKAEAQRLLSIGLYVPGETFIVAEDVALASKDIWYVCSTSEVRSRGGGVEVDRSNVYGGGKLQLRPGKDLLIRCWTPHPRRYDAPDSSVRAVLPVLREIEQLTKKVFAEIDSRLAGAGILWVDQDLDFPRGPKDPPGAAGLGLKLTRAMQASLQDQSSSSAMVPIVVGVPGEALGKMQHQTFHTPMQAETLTKLDHAIRRLALGLDMPPEVLLGQGDTNHWSAWQIEESTIKLQVETILTRICQGLTEGYLAPALKILKKDPEKYVLWYDTSPLVVRPNREADARELNTLEIISDEQVRKEGNWGEDAAPSDEERERKLATKLVLAQPALISNKDVQKALGIDWDIEDPNAQQQPPPDQQQPQFPDFGPPQDGENEDVPGGPGPGGRQRALPQFPADQGSPAQEAALLVGADLIVRRALERAGARLLTRARKASGQFSAVPATDLHTVIAVPAEEVPRLIGDAFAAVPELAGRVGMEPSVVEDMLAVYTTALISRAQPHRYEDFALYIDQSLDLIGHDRCEQFCRNPLHPGPCAGFRRPGVPRRDDPSRVEPNAGPGRPRARKKLTTRIDTRAVEAEMQRIAAAPEPEPVLDPAKASAAADDLRAALGGDTDAQARISELAKSVYEYQDDGAGRLRSTVIGVRPLGAGTSKRGPGMVIDLQVYDEQGRRVGTAKRTWRVDGNGKLQVRHSFFELEPQVQGGGFSRRHNARNYQAYREMGVGRVSLTADATVGGAAWALEGYDWTTREDMTTVADRWRRVHSRLQPGPIRDEINRLLLRTTDEDWRNGTHPSPYEFAMIGARFPREKGIRGTNRTITTWLGKDVMADTQWEGSLGITEPNRPEAIPGPRPPAETAAAGEPAPTDGWDERDQFLTAVNQLDLAYANTVADDVETIPDAYDPPGDYPEHHHYFSADAEESQVYTDLAADLLDQWGRNEDAMVAHAGCAEFCRNPLHPGPCRGWRRQINTHPDLRRDKDTTPEPSRRGRKSTPAKKAAPTPPPAPRETDLQRRNREAREAAQVRLEAEKLGAEAARKRDLTRAQPMARVSPEGYTPARFQDDLYVAAAGSRVRATPDEQARAAAAQQRLSDWARAVWQQTDTQSGLRAQVQYVTVAHPYGQPDRPSMAISLTIHDAQGRQVGTSTRNVGIGVLHSGGHDSMQAYHAYLQLSRSVQGGGFADRYNARAYQAYAEMGVTRVGVHADIDVGGYTWATQGFDFETRQDLDQFARMAQSLTYHADPDVAAEARRLIGRSTPAHWAAGTHPTPYEFAMIGREKVEMHLQGQTSDGTNRYIFTWPGKSMLLGSSWHGVRPITRAVRRGGTSPYTQRGTPRKAAKKAAKKAVTAAAEAPMDAVEPEVDETLPGWDERYDFLDDVASWSSAWANTIGDEVPVYEEDAHPNRNDETDYNANQHLISADMPQTMAFLNIVREVLGQWGRLHQEVIPEAPDGTTDTPDGVTASGEPAAPFPGHDAFCRNPLHPGPCRGWRRQVDIAPESRRDKGPEPSTPRKRAPAKKAVPAKKATPPATPGPDADALTASTGWVHPGVYVHAEFCRNPLHPGPCKRVFDVPQAKKRRKRKLTGHFTFGRSRWWDQLTEDDDEGSPVDNLTVQISTRDYHVAHGTVYRIDGVAFLVEHDPDEQSTRNAHQAVQAVYDVHRLRIAPVDEGFQKAYFIGERESPTEADKHANGSLEPGRHIAGQAGDGSTSVWGYTRDYFRPGDIAPIVSHEYGHNVGHGAPRVTDSVTGEVRRVDESRGWLDAGMADARRGGPQSRVTGAQIDPGDQVARRWFSELNAGMIPDSPYPVGVTPYGTTSMREDFAESVSMYLTGQIATGFPMNGVDALTDEDVPIYFRDYFPARAAELDKLFPTFAQRQLEQIRQERSQSGS